MYSEDYQLTLSETDEAAICREAKEIRKVCQNQRRMLAEQWIRLQAVRRSIEFVHASLEISKLELLETRIDALELSAGINA